jgi:integrase/recombinase XerC
LDEDPDTPLIRGTGMTLRSALAAATNTIIEVLDLAGLRDGFVVPMSLPNWAGRRAFEETGRIEEAARTLGLRTLDAAARQIGWSWR